MASSDDGKMTWDDPPVTTALHQPLRKALQDVSDGHERASFRTLPDWSENAVNGDHLWTPISASGELCYFLDQNICSKQGQRYRCSSCKMIVHKSCADQIATLPDRKKYMCKPTFRDVGVRQYREQMIIEHHWIHKKNQKGKCKQCSKAFQSKLSFSSGKDVVAVVCSWCKMACHNKEPCFVEDRFRERCTLGLHANIILPPSWIVKLPRKGSFKSSLRKSPKRKTSSKRKPKKEGERDGQVTFVVKPIPSPNSKPLLVFINPRSGGNQGSKLLAKFQWLLNPRQVFDLSQGGPATGIELFRKVPNLRILACGGDGTAGWILSTLDTMGIDPPPAVAVLPLGTGNDLARSLGWGGGYTDEPISKILCNVEEGEVVQLDRWDLKVETNPYPDPNNAEDGKASLPLDVLNNYFSLGADAYIALEFHEAREAHPEKFSSRLRNKMFYGQAGGKDLLQRKWKDLSDYVSLECDGKDITPKLKELKVHAIVFLNIPSYSAGTRPWNSQVPGLQPQRTDDSLIEVIGLTTYQLPLLQAGGHGTCLAQCRHVRMATTRTIPMQVDGEPCKLSPSLIEMKLRNKATMVAKSKKHSVQQHMRMSLEKLTVDVARIGMADYENYHYDKDLLRQQSIPLGTLIVQQDADLEQVRGLVSKLMKGKDDETDGERRLPSDWCFLDGCTCERFFRIDRAQENIHFITDISNGEVYILEPERVEPDRDPCEPVPRMAMVDDSNGDLKIEAAVAGSSSRSAVGPLMEQHSSEPEVDPASSRGRRPKPPLGRAVRPQALCETSYFLENYPEDVIEMSKSDDMRSLKEMHAAGRSLLAIDQDGMTPLHHASSLGHKDVVRFLIANAPGSIIDMPDGERGRTALHWAAANKRRTICCMLVAAGAALTSVDREGLTPSQLASQAGDEELAAYLESQKCFQGTTSNNQETAV